MKINFKNNSEITTLSSDQEKIRGHRAKLPLFEQAARLSIEDMNRVLEQFIVKEDNKEKFKREYEAKWISSHPIDYVAISFRNNGVFNKKSVYRPIIKKTDDESEKVIGVITEVNEELVTGVIYADIVPKINNGYVCSVELKEKRYV